MTTAITHTRVFDGDRVIEDCTVVLDGATIARVGQPAPLGADVVDGRGATLLPGLIDAHVHTSLDALRLSLRFGVTTQLEMQGIHTAPRRAQITDDDTVADVRSAGFGITPPGGHPSELFPPGNRPGSRPRTDDEPAHDEQTLGEVVMPFATTPEQAVDFVAQLVASGSDYIKFMIDDGSVEGHPGLPMLDQATVSAGAAEARRLDKLTIAHALTLDATRMAVTAGIDGLAHMFMDQPHTPDIVDALAASGAFVVPCVVLDASMMGITAADLAADPRVADRLPPEWLAVLHSSYDRYPQGDLEEVLVGVAALHAAGVDLLVGTDVAPVPLPFMGGMAPGASVHHELQMLVRAGLTPVEALRAATSVPARRFHLDDRGRIANGYRADLVLVDGDPTSTITDTLNLRAVWRRGVPASVAELS